MTTTLVLGGLKRFGYGVAVVVTSVYAIELLGFVGGKVKDKFFTKAPTPPVAA